MRITRGMVMRTLSAAIIFSMAFILMIHRETLAAREPLRIAVASNLGNVVDELGKAFNESYPDVRVEFVTGSSGKLATQIIHGAPFDIFLAADMSSPENLYVRHLAVDHPVEYARGTLIVFTTKGFSLTTGMALLALPEIQRIALADPVSAPYGKAAVEAMRKAGMYDRISGKLVQAPSVAEVIAYTTTGADVGFAALSLLKAPWMETYDVEGKYWVAVDKRLYAPLRQGMVILAYARNRKDARDFYDFLLSTAAKRILREHGYTV